MRRVYRFSTCIWRSTRRIENISIFHTTHGKMEKRNNRIETDGYTHGVDSHSVISIAIISRGSNSCLYRPDCQNGLIHHLTRKNTQYVHIFFFFLFNNKIHYASEWLSNTFLCFRYRNFGILIISYFVSVPSIRSLPHGI